MNRKLMITLLGAVLALAAVTFVLVQRPQQATDQMQQELLATPMPETTDMPVSGEAQALSEDDEASDIELVQLSGIITEITDDYIMLDAGEMGQIPATLTEDSINEGVDTLLLGQVAIVTYDGKMTRSLPPQITALHLGVYEVKGTVTAVEDGRITLSREEGGDEVVLTLPENAPELAVGDAVTAYTTGISTMSLPPIMNAVAILVN